VSTHFGLRPRVDLAQALSFCTGAERIRGEHYLTTTGAAALKNFLNENDSHYENETHFGFFSKPKKKYDTRKCHTKNYATFSQNNSQ
jgi:hypothetical protein